MKNTQWLQELIDRLGSSRTRAIIKIGSQLRISAGLFLRERGFVEINPVIISPLTDPLHHKIIDGAINYYGHKFYLTRSMIFHKQIALLGFEKIFIFSPNVRLELVEFAHSYRHLIEFTQLDIEMKNARREDVMKLAEELLIHIIKELKKECAVELSLLNRNLQIPKVPFKKLPYLDAYKRYGPDFEDIISRKEKDPFWVVDFPVEAREFYDREYKERPGILCDMDLVYPEGFGEALSGGEREFEYQRILKRMAYANMNFDDYQWYFPIAQKGLPRSAGFGIGIERLVRFLGGLSSITEATLFPKVPGRVSL